MCSPCGPFIKNKKGIKKLKKHKIQDIYQNKLDKFCCQHDMTYGDFKPIIKEELLLMYYVIKQLILLNI